MADIAQPMADIATNPIYSDEAAARAHLEGIRWPQGVRCVHCGAYGDAISQVQKTAKRRKPAAEGRRHKPARAGRYYCKECEGTFTVTVGTIMADSHVQLLKWLHAFHLMLSARKGVSAHQLHRTLGVSYKTAWFMGHRMREALRSGILAPPMGGGPQNIVSADETFIGRTDGELKATTTRPSITPGRSALWASTTPVQRGVPARARSFLIEALCFDHGT